MLLPLEENYSSQIYPQNAIYVLRSSYLCKSIDNSFASLRARHWHRCSHVDYLTHANYSGLPRHSKFIARPSPTSPSPASRMRSSSPLGPPHNHDIMALCYAWEVTMSLTIWNAPNSAPSWIFSDVPAVKLYLHEGTTSKWIDYLTRVILQLH